MKKFVFSFIVVLLGFGRALAILPPDEGMWMPLLISGNYAEMQRMGIKLKPEDIYSINQSSIKDAVVWFGGGCTGEIVSKEGLLFTNHHCGYGSISALSSKENDYLKNGFWAKNKSEELPAQGLTVSILQRMEDVTNRVLAELNGLNPEERSQKINVIFKKIQDEAIKGTTQNAIVREMYRGSEYYLFVFETFKDIRLVGTPNSSIGKFGGDTDNWMWPRHTGDFSIFRIYANKDNKPAAYAADNVPYKPKHSLPVSLKGYKENDFAFIMGFPGRTNRYLSSKNMQFNLEVSNPAIIDGLGLRTRTIKKAMDANKDVQLAYASNYASLMNTYKYYIGQTEGLNRLNVIAQKAAQEAEFMKWVNADQARIQKYGTVLQEIDRLYNENRNDLKHFQYLTLCINASKASGMWQKYGNYLKMMMDTAVKPDQLKAENEKLSKDLENSFKGFFPDVDKEVFARLLELYIKTIPAKEVPEAVLSQIAKYKGKTLGESIDKLAANIYTKSIFLNKEKTQAFLAKPNAKIMAKDPLISFFKSFEKTADALSAKSNAIRIQTNEPYQKYIQALREMNPSKSFYPDANSSIRYTYGKVSDYSPKDAVDFSYYTTSEGILEKMDNNNEEFEVPAKLEELLRKRDFGRYAENGKLHVAFLSDNDITGGNSGSPVINGNGELIGIAFDGNWEAMTGDLVYDGELKRTISVDIRYVLFIIDKYAGASNLINELNIVN